MNKPKVVHLINVDVGVRVHLRNQLHYLKRKGYEVTAICPPGPLVSSDGVTPEGIPVRTVPMSRDIRPWDDLRTILQLVRIFRTERFDIVHTHSVKPGLLGRLAARLVGVPCIVHTVHGLLLHEGMSWRSRWLWWMSEKVGATLGDYMLSQSRQDMAILVEQNICRVEKLGYLGNGIDLCQFDPTVITQQEVEATRQALGVNNQEKVIALVGRLSVEKGCLEFTEMARCIHRRYPATKFWLIGRQETDKAGRLGVEDIITDDMQSYVRYLGLRSDMPRLYAAMDILVFPSHHEGMPRSLMEASAMGKAIVATDIRGCQEVVIKDVTGLLVPVRDSNSLVRAVSTLLDNPALTHRLGRAARAHAQQHFDERVYFQRLNATYEHLLQECGIVSK